VTTIVHTSFGDAAQQTACGIKAGDDIREEPKATQFAGFCTCQPI
jgi:hypothetical protein